MINENENEFFCVRLLRQRNTIWRSRLVAKVKTRTQSLHLMEI